MRKNPSESRRRACPIDAGRSPGIRRVGLRRKRRLACVVEDHAESHTLASMDAREPVAKLRTGDAASTLDGTLAGGEDEPFAAREREGIAPRLLSGTLLDEQEFAPLEVAPRLGGGTTSWKGNATAPYRSWCRQLNPFAR